MVWLIIGVFVILVVWFLVAKSKPSGFAKGVAKAQLKAYKTAKIRNPQHTKEELYVEAISSRPGVLKHFPLGEIKHNATNCKYVSLVEMLVHSEFEHRLGRKMTFEELEVLSGVVSGIIPEDL